MTHYSLYRGQTGLKPLLLSLHLLWATVPTHAYAAPANHSIDSPKTGVVQAAIPEGKLAESLKLFALQAGVLIVMNDEALAGKTAPALYGSVSLAAGFDKLTQASGFVVLKTASGYIVKAGTPKSAAAGAPPIAETSDTVLPEVLVHDHYEPHSYRAQLPVSSATRSDHSIMDVPQTVDVVSGAAIEDRNALSIKDALAYTPGVTTSTGEGIREQFIIRGFSAIADTYVDGMRDGRNTFRDTFSLEQLEVVKGPAGVLYGRGSAGGLINLVSKKATANAFAKAGAMYGSYDASRLTLDINQPLTDNALFRVNAMIDDSDSFRSEVWSKKRGIAIASTLRLAEKVTLDLNAQHLVDKRVFDAGIPGIYGKPADVSTSTYYGGRNPGSSDNGSSEDNSLNADLKVAINDQVSLRNTTRYSYLNLERNQTTIDRLILNSAVPTVRLARSNFFSTQHDLTNRFEVLLKQHWLGIDHDWMVGTELSWEERDTISRGGTLANTFNISVYDPVLRQVPLLGSSIRRDGIYQTQTTSLYLQDMMRFNPQWVALLGVRKDWLDRNFDNRAGADYGRKDSFFSPRLGVVYQPDTQSSYYLSSSRSYQPGAATGVIDPGSVITPPEITTNFEIGSKYSLNQGKLQLGISLFKLIKENVPTRDPSDSTATLYVGEITSNGLELSALGDLGDGYSLQGGVTLLDARVTRSNNTTAPAVTPAVTATALEGKRAANAPELMATVWAMKKLNDQWRAGLGVRHMSESYASTTNAVQLPAYTVLDAGLYHEHGPWSLALNIRNLTDKTYYESSTNDLGILPGAPRLMQFTANYQFK
ncbi:TonB-dependent receptor [Methylophilus aquaticus]|uniref:TonB-dependent siderophore receptor n=1 Tax=Methylophilus aquaticus TaxID=1971610 RepID=A0ABT9JUP1_9PROT|nr:TonB-dependent siderophore receptor [Methylophilus aquaticus]MDP8568321.1 TonB-dependent siderophore receptor [Methylophilus aquaticus]